MPSPVEALPWGSRSSSSTRSPTAARAVPRLIAVVVLPTPPFWLTTARTRKGASGVDMAQLSQFQDPAGSAAAAGQALGLERPDLGSLSHFRLDVLTLEEQSRSPFAEVGPCEFEQATQGCAS